jgi:hypothetical protein
MDALPLKNNNCFMKQKTSKKPIHRRFGSCEVPKSAITKSAMGSNREKEKEVPREKERKSKFGRRKSA